MAAALTPPSRARLEATMEKRILTKADT
jgi:hypothetical protein